MNMNSTEKQHLSTCFQANKSIKKKGRDKYNTSLQAHSCKPKRSFVDNSTKTYGYPA